MKNNYFVLFIAAFFLFSDALLSQEIKIFTAEDFDLVGKVKSCMVSAHYGKEEYDFNKNGFLTKSVTRYNESDYDITYYTYDKAHLLEKRLEIYRNKTLDASSSIANFYTRDSISNLKVTEKIISYQKDFLDQFEYYFKTDTLVRIVRSNNSGIDETLITYAEDNDKKSKSYHVNGVLQKLEETTIQLLEDGVFTKVVRTQKFIEGEPSSAIEVVYGLMDKLLSKKWLFFNEETKQYEQEKMITYTYDELDKLASTRTTKGATTVEKNFLYQYDKNGNWVKEIITPDNTYKSRSITYYEIENIEKQPE